MPIVADNMPAGPDAPRPVTSPPKKRPLMLGTIALLLVMAVSLAGLIAWNSWQSHRHQLRDAEIATSNMARALARYADDTLHNADNILLSITDRLMADGVHCTCKPLRHFLERFTRDNMNVSEILIIDADGKVSLSSHQPQQQADKNFAAKDFFRHHLTRKDALPHVGQAIKTLAGNWIIPISRRIDDRAGRFAGVIVASIPLESFEFFYNEFDIGSAGAIVLMTDHGTLLIRRPFIEDMIGADVSNGPIYQNYLRQGPIGTEMMTSYVDHTRRLYSYRHLDDFPLIIAVARSSEEIFAEWRSESFRLVVVGMFMLALLGFAGVYLIYQILQKEAIEAALEETRLTLETLNLELEKIASEDALTGLANRRRFDVALQTEFSRAARNRSTLSLAMIDVDYFKQFNDLYGHQAGDTALAAIASTLRKIPGRAGDLIARYGGEEIVALLPDTNAEGAAALGERLRSAIESLCIPHKASRSGVLTISVGVATCQPTNSDITPARLLRMADEALYDAKAAGRNHVCMHGSLPS